jgi:hypothetical protein
MDSWKSHLAFTFVFLLAVWAVNQFWKPILGTTSWVVLVIYLPVILLGGIFPDLDKAGTKISVAFTVAFLGLAIWQFFAGSARVSIGLVIITFLLYVWYLLDLIKHRGWVHSISFGLLVSLPILLIGWHVAIFFFLAFLSHLVADSITGKWCLKLW